MCVNPLLEVADHLPKTPQNNGCEIFLNPKIRNPIILIGVFICVIGVEA
jgi:hypothetical protein